MPRLPFLGGPISAILVALTLEPYQQRALPWFALVPLLLSCQRHRRRPWARFAHGAAFGLVLGAVAYPWLYGGEMDRMPGGPVPTPALEAILASAGGSGALAIQAGLFALGSGILLRSRHSLLACAGLACLWTGTEVLRGLLAPTPWTSGWCVLGYGLRPETLEGQLASTVGIFGMSFAVTLSSALFLSVLRESKMVSQFAFAAVGILIPVICHEGGTWTVPHAIPERSLSVLVAARRGEDVESLVDLSARLDERADLVAWPRIQRGVLGRRSVGDRVESPPVLGFLQATDAHLVASTEDPGGDAIVMLDAAGRIAFVGEASGTPPPWTFDLPSGKVGLVLAPRRDAVGEFRETCASGAQTIIVSSAAEESGGRRAFLQRSLMDRVRAVENRRWIVRAGEGGAVVVNPLGGVDLEVRGGLSGAGVEKIGMSKTITPYVSVGWWLEPLCLAVTATILVASAVAGLRRH